MAKPPGGVVETTTGTARTYVSADGTITLHMNHGELGDFSYYIDAAAGYSTQGMGALLQTAEAHGLELIDGDECEPTILRDGTVRIYLAPVYQPGCRRSAGYDALGKRVPLDLLSGAAAVIA